MVPQFQRALADNTSQALVRYTGEHSADCGYTTSYRTRRRPGGCRGDRGPSGYAPNSKLHPGLDGKRGSASIIVLGDDGEEAVYGSKFDFELEGFSVTDENGDGVFEPGECVIVGNIKVWNRGT